MARAGRERCYVVELLLAPVSVLDEVAPPPVSVLELLGLPVSVVDEVEPAPVALVSTYHWPPTLTVSTVSLVPLGVNGAVVQKFCDAPAMAPLKQ